jgi:hypothetical protein
VKPIDKIIPRRIMDAFGGGDGGGGGRRHVHVATHPAFFRAPMLTSQIHSQWDAEFCISSECQMMWTGDVTAKVANDTIRMSGDFDTRTTQHGSTSSSSHVWNCLWLNHEEKCVVDYQQIHKEWLRYREIMERTSG